MLLNEVLETITYYLHFAENPIQFGSVVKKKY